MTVNNAHLIYHRGKNMKKTNIKLKVGGLAVIAALCSTGAVAETQNGVAVATVITPLVINNLVTMDFTTIASGSSGGTLAMDNAGAITPSGDAIVIGGGGGTPLGFDITGEASQAYTLTVGDGVLSDGTNTMAIAMDAVPATPLTGSAQSITVGGTLTVGASQPAGSYTTNAPGTPIVITANYN